MARYEVRVRRVWVNKETGLTASIYGAVPYTSSKDKENWEIKEQGFSVWDNKRNVIFTPYSLIGNTSKDSYEEWVYKNNLIA